MSGYLKSQAIGLSLLIANARSRFAAKHCALSPLAAKGCSRLTVEGPHPMLPLNFLRCTGLFHLSSHSTPVRERKAQERDEETAPLFVREPCLAHGSIQRAAMDLQLIGPRFLPLTKITTKTRSMIRRGAVR